jgi:hypothetical protein
LVSSFAASPPHFNSLIHGFPACLYSSKKSMPLIKP